MQWHLITCEYPPIAGGVADHTALLAQELAAAGDDVWVWCPGSPESWSSDTTVHVSPLCGTFAARDLRRMDQALARFPGPRRLLLQWVPHGYGYRAMNVGFCWWLWKRSRLWGDDVQILFHEAFLMFGEGTWKQDAVAAVHRVMTVLLLQASWRAWVSTPLWEPRLRPFLLGKRIPFDWLPVPSNVPPIADRTQARGIRARCAPDGVPLVGHFGTYGRQIADFLLKVLPALCEQTNASTLLLGRDSERFRDRLLERNPELGERIHATGYLDAAALSLHLTACDLMIQPYADGVSARRGSSMAALSHGLPLLTTEGLATEPVWRSGDAVALVPPGDPVAFAREAQRLLADARRSQRLAANGRALYEERFSLPSSVNRLRAVPLFG